MNKITTGLATASLAALALGAAAPAAATAAPASSSDPSVDHAQTRATPAPHVGQIVAHGERHIAVNGVARGATRVTLAVDGGVGGSMEFVALDRFSFLVDAEHLGKKAVVTAYGPQGPSEGVEIVLELGEDEGATVPPNAPVVHAVSAYDDEHLVIEGTVTYDPSLFSRTEVHASVRGVPVYDFPDENGSFSLRVPVAYAGQTIDVQAFRDGLGSEAISVELVETADNTASDAFPLGVDSPSSGSVLTTPDATFAGSGIPNSTIVVTRDEKTNRASSTLCETRVASSGDWSCTSAALPAGDYATTVTETPAWRSAVEQTAGTSFSVAGQADSYDQAQLPSVSSITLDSRGDLIVRVISHGASEVRLEVGDEVETERAIHGRTAFTLDAELLGRDATLTGVRGDVDGRSLDLPLDLLDAAPVAPLTSPRVHGVTQSAPGRNFLIAATTDYFHDEYVVPSVIAKIDDVFAGAPQATWNGALYLQLGAEHAGKTVELVTTRGLREQSESTFFTLETTESNTAPETFPLGVTSPAEGETVAADLSTFTGEGIPGSRISVATDVTRAGELCTADVLGDGTWSCEVDAPLAHGEHTMTVTETPYWADVRPIESTRSFTVATDDGESDEREISVTSPVDGSTFAAGSVVTFTGTATANADIAVHLGYGLAPVTGTADTTGAWTVSRWLGNAPYTATVIQTVNGQQIGDRHTGPTITPATTTPVVVTSPVDGSTFAAGSVVTFTGTATANADIAVHLGYGLAPVTGTADATGAWTVSRWLGNAPYTATVIQSENGSQIGAAHTGPTITPAP